MSRINVANFRHPDGTSDNISLDSSTNVTSNGNLLFAATSNTADQSIQFGDPDATNRGFFNYRHSEDQLQIGAGGSTKVAINSDGGFAFNSGYGSVGVAYGVRAWINFDGTAATIGTGRASGNMDAVTDNGSGDYTLNFTNDMPDANYCVAGICFETGSTGATDNFIGIKRATNYSDSVTAGSVRIATNGGGDRSCFVMIVR